MAKKGVMIGYQLGMHNWRILREDGEVKLSHDVTFDKNLYPGISTPNPAGLISLTWLSHLRRLNLNWKTLRFLWLTSALTGEMNHLSGTFVLLWRMGVSNLTHLLLIARWISLMLFYQWELLKLLTSTRWMSRTRF